MCAWAYCGGTAAFLAALLTVDHGDHAVLGGLAGHAVGDDLDGDGVALVRLQLGDVVERAVAAGALRVHQRARVLALALDGVRVVVGLGRAPGAGDGGGALGPAVDVLNPLGP